MADIGQRANERNKYSEPEREREREERLIFMLSLFNNLDAEHTFMAYVIILLCVCMCVFCVLCVLYRQKTSNKMLATHNLTQILENIKPNSVIKITQCEVVY